MCTHDEGLSDDLICRAEYERLVAGLAEQGALALGNAGGGPASNQAAADEWLANPARSSPPLIAPASDDLLRRLFEDPRHSLPPSLQTAHCLLNVIHMLQIIPADTLRDALPGNIRRAEHFIVRRPLLF